MATTPTYDAAMRMVLAGTSVTPGHPTEKRIANLPATITRAEEVYVQSVQSSGVVTAVAFFVTTAIAVGYESASPSLLLTFLGVALFSAGSSQPLARYRFRSVIEAATRKEGHSK